MSELDLLGFRIRGAASEAPRALTSRTSQQPPRDALIRLNQIMRGWANYFKHAVCKHTLDALENFAWHRVIRWWMQLHRWKWKDVRRHLTGPHGRWRKPAAAGVELFNIAKVPVTRYRYRGSKIPSPLGTGQPRLKAAVERLAADALVQRA